MQRRAQAIALRESATIIRFINTDAQGRIKWAMNTDNIILRWLLTRIFRIIGEHDDIFFSVSKTFYASKYQSAVYSDSVFCEERHTHDEPLNIPCVVNTPS